MAITHIGEIVEKLRACETKAEAVELLRKHRGHTPFRTFVNYLFNPTISFYDFEGSLPDPNRILTSISYGRGISLYSQMRHIGMFLLSPERNYPKDRMMIQFERIVENLPGIEGELFVCMLTGQPVEGLTLDIVAEAYADDARFCAMVVKPAQAIAKVMDKVPTQAEVPPAQPEAVQTQVTVPVETEAKTEEAPVAQTEPGPVHEPVAVQTTQEPVKRGPGRPPGAQNKKSGKKPVPKSKPRPEAVQTATPQSTQEFISPAAQPNRQSKDIG